MRSVHPSALTNFWTKLHMNYPKGSTKKLQKYIEYKCKERGFDDETLQERLLLLTEEVGELIKSTRKHIGIKASKHSAETTVGHELADVLNLLFLVAAELKIDLEQAHIEKELEIDNRHYTKPEKIL